MSDIALKQELSFDEVAELDTLEMRIESGLKTFYEVGDSLMRIRDGKLYREKFGTFEDYCRERWQITRQRAHQLIGSTEQRQKMSRIFDKTELPQKESQLVALGAFDEELQPVIMRVARARSRGTGQSITAGLIKAIGESLEEATSTGHVDTGNGESTPFEASVSVADSERAKRQDEHIKERSVAKDSRGQWRDHFGELNEDDQRVATEVTRDITSSYGREKALQSVAHDVKRLAENRDDWGDLGEDEKRNAIMDVFSQKQEKSYSSGKPDKAPVTRVPTDDIKSLESACLNLVECARSDKGLTSFTRQQMKASLEQVNAVVGRMLA